jgi:hypothetical protein
MHLKPIESQAFLFAFARWVGDTAPDADRSRGVGSADEGKVGSEVALALC